MKKILKFIFLCLCITFSGKGCMSVDKRGRLEKIRFSVPAFFQVELDYYKNKDNMGRPIIKTNSPGAILLKPQDLSVKTNALEKLWEPAEHVYKINGVTYDRLYTGKLIETTGK